MYHKRFNFIYAYTIIGCIYIYLGDEVACNDGVVSSVPDLKFAEELPS